MHTILQLHTHDTDPGHMYRHPCILALPRSGMPNHPPAVPAIWTISSNAAMPVVCPRGKALSTSGTAAEAPRECPAPCSHTTKQVEVRYGLVCKGMGTRMYVEAQVLLALQSYLPWMRLVRSIRQFRDVSALLVLMIGGMSSSACVHLIWHLLWRVMLFRGRGP